ncbi:MAG: PilZ domain-containing protein [Gammaproteobacteria bacterium]|nr:PilZ domain-containing protein [Gammaproteobacteria bacterium]MBL4728753.1 PilZ domain-containing protein [Gammaproteobacteria bacterium]
MKERRRHKRVEVNFWASLSHPLLGTVTCDIQDMSISGVSIKLDEDLKFFVMMELDVKIRGDGWDDSMPALPVQVTRVDKREIGLQFIESCEELWVPSEDDLNFSADNSNPMQDFAAHGDLGKLA